MAHRDVLPDSRPREKRGAVYVLGVGWMIPIYCINCGRRWGFVPEKMVTHVTALCDTGCANVYGVKAEHECVDADNAVREHLNEAMLQDYGKILSQVELTKAMDHPSKSLAAVARDWHARTSRVN